jgi:Histidine kinase-, DNA gyrase B-, and HSP90-like ATPase
VEDALLELVRNARDAGARNVFIASVLRLRRYRTLTVIDDGHGIPEHYKDLIFEPGVTTRHLDPTPDPARPAGAGLSLYHLRNAALNAEVISTASPTSIQATFDTHTLPERTLQSPDPRSRTSRTNLPETLRDFTRDPGPNLFYASPAQIVATLLVHHIILNSEEEAAATVQERAAGLGLGISLRTVQRILRGDIPPVGMLSARREKRRRAREPALEGSEERAPAEPAFGLGGEEISQIAAILRRAARASYLEVGDLVLDARPGEICVRARVYEPEESYDE